MIRVADLVRGELPVSAADDVVFAVVNQQVLRVDGLVVEGQDAGGEDTAGGFQVAVAMICMFLSCFIMYLSFSFLE